MKQMRETQRSRCTSLALHCDADVIAGRTGSFARLTGCNIVRASKLAAAADDLPVGKQNFLFLDRRLERVVLHERQMRAQWRGRSILRMDQPRKV